jgi:hypothetical protein
LRQVNGGAKRRDTVTDSLQRAFGEPEIRLVAFEDEAVQSFRVGRGRARETNLIRLRFFFALALAFASASRVNPAATAAVTPPAQSFHADPRIIVQKFSR